MYLFSDNEVSYEISEGKRLPRTNQNEKPTPDCPGRCNPERPLGIGRRAWSHARTRDARSPVVGARYHRCSIKKRRACPCRRLCYLPSPPLLLKTLLVAASGSFSAMASTGEALSPPAMEMRPLDSYSPAKARPPPYTPSSPLQFFISVPFLLLNYHFITFVHSY